MTGQRGRLGALAGSCHVHEIYYNLAEVSFFWWKSVFRDVCMQSCLAFRFLVTLRPPLHEIFAFLSNIRPSLAFMRTSRKTESLKTIFMDMTYPKGWTGSLPLCPLILSWFCPYYATRLAQKTRTNFSPNRKKTKTIVSRSHTFSRALLNGLS